MIWDVIKKIILSGMVSWIVFIIIAMIGNYKLLQNQKDFILDRLNKSDISKMITAYEDKAQRIGNANSILSISIFILLTFIILFF